jgi:uncharacterized membrane protein YqjE
MPFFHVRRTVLGNLNMIGQGLEAGEKIMTAIVAGIKMEVWGMMEEEINSVILTVMKGVAVVVIIIGYSFLIYLFILCYWSSLPWYFMVLDMFYWFSSFSNVNLLLVIHFRYGC